MGDNTEPRGSQAAETGTAPGDPSTACAVCGAALVSAGTKRSTFSGRDFALARCPACHWSCVLDPRTDYAELYDADYYAGAGANGEVDYEQGLADPKALQEYEWKAVTRIVEGLTAGIEHPRWLDYGCGLGGLVRYARAHGHDVSGFDEGFAAERLRADGVPSIEKADLPAHHGTFDVITSIEVLEHTPDPIGFLTDVAALLKPGGVFYLTTGNATPFRERLSSWQYVQPDIHISFFEPETLERAMRAAGLVPEPLGYVDGTTTLIRCKILRTFKVRRRGVLESLVPWPIVSRVADRRYGVTAHPIGRKPVSPTGS